MYWFDGHCDVLWRRWDSRFQNENRDFYDLHSSLDVNEHYMKEIHQVLQVFATFVPTKVAVGQRFATALAQIDDFYEHIIRDGEKLFPVTTREDIHECSPQRMGALLAMEGADALQGELSNLRTFYRLGVRQIGLTWNYANEVADGIEEDRGGGLTRFGRQVVEEMMRFQMILDVSHLSVRGFWEVVDVDQLPVIASHSNSLTICQHKRNLDDSQIRAIIEKQGLIGLTYYPPFVHQGNSKVTIAHLLRHVEYICELGGENQLCFGSDFDGIDVKIVGLENVRQVQNLKEALLQRYPESLVQKWAWKNACSFYAKHLMSKSD
ncbi:dipeptidase [Hazenella coriacea]|uniref:Membrane dipeptidase n=1 Tax=Hazenella coriacea TaxID=1179467 RepID=A0A4V6NZ72_9BACL|nr:dipeptidase [Hazenella coriacea]TCS92598.1 membrane dipeptidase [Hazenella coriacea]